MREDAGGKTGVRSDGLDTLVSWPFSIPSALWATSVMICACIDDLFCFLFLISQ